MARQLRIFYRNAFYHVMNRGAGKRNIFHCREDYEKFFESIEVACTRFNGVVHAYCLMSNHYHLLIRTPDANLDRIMRHISAVYTQKHNQSYGTDGPLFRGRYRANLVQDNYYFFNASRYVHRNPIDAGMVKRIEEYEWSSFHAYLNPAIRPAWLDTDFTLSGNSQASLEADRIADYEQFVNQECDQETIDYFEAEKGGGIYGSDDFKKLILGDVPELYYISSGADIKRTQVKPTVAEIVEKVAEFFDITRDKIDYVSKGYANIPLRYLIVVCHDAYAYYYRDIVDELDSLSLNSMPSFYARSKAYINDDTKRLEKYNQLRNKLVVELIS